MAFPCCMGIATGVRLASLLSLVLGLIAGGLGGWLFKETYDYRNSAEGKTRDALGDGLTNLFGSVGIETKVDLDKIARIKYFCSATVTAAAALQVLTSLFLLFCSGTKGGRAVGRLYVFLNTFVIVALGAVVACFFTAEGIDYENDTKIQSFIAASVADLIALVYLICVAGAFVRSS